MNLTIQIVMSFAPLFARKNDNVISVEKSIQVKNKLTSRWGMDSDISLLNIYKIRNVSSIKKGTQCIK